MSTIIEFNDFRVNKSTRKIFKNDKQVSIQKKPYELLLYLIEHRERAVSKDELINKVWNGSIVSDSTLSHAIFKLRASLRDHKGKEKIIRTARGYGFQFIAQLKRPENDDPIGKASLVKILSEKNLSEKSLSEKASSNKSITNNKKKHIDIKFYLKSLIFVCILIFLIYLISKNVLGQNETLDTQEPQAKQDMNALAFVANSNNKDHWLFQSLNHYMNQVLAYSKDTNPQQLLLMDHSSQNQNLMMMEDENKILTSFENNNLSLSYHSQLMTIDAPVSNISETIKQVNDWICVQVLSKSKTCKNTMNELTSHNSFILGNYLRGLYSHLNGQYEKAINYYNICLQEDKNFSIARLALSKSYYSLSQYNKSIAQLQTVISTASNKRLIEQARILLGKSYFRISEYENAETTFLNIIDSHLDNNSIKAYALIELAQIYQEKSNLNNAFSHAQKGNKMLEDKNLPVLMARSYKIMGSIKNTQGNLDDADKYLTKALNLYEDLNELNGLESVLSQLGSIYQAKGDLKTSLAYANRRQAIVERLGDPISIAGSHLQLSYLYLEIGNLESATEHANKMWKIAAKEQEPRAQMMAGLILGEISNAKNHTQQSLDHYSQALKISRELGLKRREVIMLCNMGKVAIDGMLYIKAQELLTLCHQEAEKSSYQLFQAVAQLYLGELFRNQNQFYRSETHLSEALKIANTMNNDDIKKGIHLEYFYLYFSDDLSKAEHHLQLVPESHKESFLYLIAKSELEFEKNNYLEAHNNIIHAKQLSGDNWSIDDQSLFDKILLKLE